MKKAFLFVSFLLNIISTHVAKVTSETCEAVVLGSEYVCTDDLDKVMEMQHTDENEEEIDYGIPQLVYGTEDEIATTNYVIWKMYIYYKKYVIPHKKHKGIRKRCKNFNEMCAYWTSVGECDNNRAFMLTHCAASCRLCVLAELTMGS